MKLALAVSSHKKYQIYEIDILNLHRIPLLYFCQQLEMNVFLCKSLDGKETTNKGKLWKFTKNKIFM